MSRAVQYRKFGGPGILQMAEVADPAPSGGEVRVAVKAVGLNPVDAKIFGGDIRLKILESIQCLTHPVRWFGSPRFPRGWRAISPVASMLSGRMYKASRSVNLFWGH